MYDGTGVSDDDAMQDMLPVREETPTVSFAEYAPELYDELFGAFNQAEATGEQLPDINIVLPKGFVFGTLLSSEMGSVLYRRTPYSEGSGLTVSHDGQWFAGNRLYSAAHIGPFAVFGDRGDYTDLDLKPSLMLSAAPEIYGQDPLPRETVVGLPISRRALDRVQVTVPNFIPRDHTGREVPIFNAAMYGTYRK